MDAHFFLKLLRSCQRGSISRRTFLGRTGLGLATAVLAAQARPVLARPDLGDRLVVATWPHYYSQENLDHFQQATGVKVTLDISGSNEEMLAKLRDNTLGIDVLVGTNYVIPSYAGQRLIEPLDLSRVPAFDASAYDGRMLAQGQVGKTTYALPKNWGTTGMLYNADKLRKGPRSWREFWHMARTRADRRTLVHDYQLTAIGNALKACGFSFNSLVPQELEKAEALMMQTRPHLLAVTSDTQPMMQGGEAWLSMAWTGDARLLRRDNSAFTYVLGEEGGELWTDFFAINRASTRKDAAYALVDYLLTPAQNVREVMAHGFPSGDKRVDALLPADMLQDPVLYPAAEALSLLEYGAAATLTSPLRAEIMARFRA
ncbi:ABC transporter substrate-binding protein [Pseudomonas sp. KNUC1026]|uniref:ABC transporter substrate-binding protein n=1 Tax=Pseudomonas sp. KNUC1026 TaxID=2893890 RepID=UPI001F416EE7|nr:spermidine/putrescine ABC transporter substrate-binding protein [Pseudomonas sp. KNUC1026]UFH50045.1 spermidine/putrescine ABC transporter substrate-binding protein [Pseudomonas sp. KNUC1026]